MNQLESGQLIPASFDSASKLLKVAGHDYAGIVTYGQAASCQTAPRTTEVAKSTLNLDDDQVAQLSDALRSSLSLPIPYQFLPLQDCVDLSMFLVRMTAAIQTWTVAVRGVGGAIDVATVTRTDGFR